MAKLAIGVNDLATVRHDLATQLVDPSLGTQLTVGSNQKVAWQCSGTDEAPHPRFQWDAKVYSRVEGGCCLVCLGRAVIAGWNDLATLRPDLAAQLVDPSLGRELTVSAGRRTVWRCEGTDGKPHPHFRWDATVSDRTRGSGCPACAGRATIVGWNDLATVRPDLAAQLVDPDLGTQLMAGSNRKVTWQCDGTSTAPHPHFEWEAQVTSRTRGSGCPACAGQTVIVGWNDLATVRPDLAAQLVDPTVGATLTAGSEEKVTWRCDGRAERPHPHFEWTTAASRRTTGGRKGNGAGCPACASQTIIVGWNDLATVRPNLSSQLVDPDLGTQLMAGSNRKVTWQCDGTSTAPHPHFEWEAQVTNRTHGHGCPACAGQTVIVGWNDLATVRPDLAAQLVDPNLDSKLTTGSNRQVTWQCDGTGDESHPRFQWDSKVYSRVEGAGCPACAKYGYDPSADGYLYRFRFTDDFRVATCFGKSNVPDKRLKSYTSPKRGLRGVADIEVLHVGSGDDATRIENLMLRLMSEHEIPACGDGGVTTNGAVTEAFYCDEATPEFIAEFDAIWQQARKQAGRPASLLG